MVLAFDKRLQVVKYVMDNPAATLREVSVTMQVSYTSVQRIISQKEHLLSQYSQYLTASSVGSGCDVSASSTPTAHVLHMLSFEDALAAINLHDEECLDCRSIAHLLGVDEVAVSKTVAQRSAVFCLATEGAATHGVVAQWHDNGGAAATRLALQDKLAILGLCRFEGVSQREAAKLFGVGLATVSRVIRESDDGLSMCQLRVEGTLASASAEGPRGHVDSSQVALHSVGAMQVACGYCGALHFPGERGRVEVIDGVGVQTFQDCCSHGKWKEPPIPFPEEMIPLLTRVHPSSSTFHKSIRSANASLAFASLNADTYNFPHNGPFCYRVHGAVLTKFNTAGRPDPPERPKYGQLYVINSEEAVQHRLSLPANREVDPDILLFLDQTLRRVNPYAQAYQSMREVEDRYVQHAEDYCRRHGLPTEEARVPEIRLLFNLKQRHQRSYNLPVVSEVAAVYVSHGGGVMPDAHIVVHPKGRRNVRTLSTLSGDLEPMCFPLLFPCGTRGWSPSTPYTRQTAKRQFVSRRQKVCARLAVRPGPFNPLHFGGRLFHEYLVTSYVYLEADRMQWFRQNQKKIKANHYEGVNARLQRLCDEGGLTRGNTVILPSTHPGSPRAQQRLFEDAMAIVQRFGKPQLFITFTANPKWAEVEDALTYYVDVDGRNPTLTASPGKIKQVHPANDRPDVVARVFDLKKAALLRMITKENFFGRVKAYVYVIEGQKRGTPHMHLLVSLYDEDAPKCTADVDRMIRATIPDPVKEADLFELVKSHHVHGPCDVGESVCLDDEGRCTKHFPKPFRRESSMGEDGYAEAARPDDGPCIEYANGKVAHNGFVVPYNAVLLKTFNAHINVELCGGIRFVKYLYKYCYKQLDSAHLEITSEGVLHCDELKRYVDCRYISAPEAVWRLMEKPLQSKSHAVMLLHVHLAHERICDQEADEPGISIDADGRYVPEKSHLDAFFRLCQEDRRARSYFYFEIPEHYWWDAKGGRWVWRKSKSTTIGRLANVDVRFKERFYLRKLLNNVRGPRSYDELKKHRGVIYSSFACACVARGLARDDAEWEECMQEAVAWQMTSQLRRLFAMILAWNEPKEPHKLWEKFRDELSEDFVRRQNFSQEQAYVAALAEIAVHLADYGKSLRDYPTMPQEVVYADPPTDEVSAADHLAEAARMYHSMNDEQKRVLDRVMAKTGTNINGIDRSAVAADDEMSDALYLDGPGGSGKTFCYLCIWHLLRAYSIPVIMMASTGVAATLLPSATTVHHAAGLPVPLFSGSKANPRGRLRQRFAAAKAPMSPRYALEAVDALLREIHGDIPFGGRLVILGGDFRQCLPIEEYSLVSEQLNLSIKRCDLWQHFTVFNLTHNMRLQSGQERMWRWQQSVGNGENLSSADGQERILDEAICDRSLIEEVYGDLFDPNVRLAGPRLIAYLTGRCIVSVLNEVCTFYNEAILERMAGVPTVSRSIDELVADSNGCHRRFPVENLNAVDLPGFPPHVLKLKKNCIVMVLRNLNVNEGLVNGTRLLVLDIRRNVLLCRILNGSRVGEVREIPRITLNYEGRQYPFKFTRHQVPVRLCFAITANKRQTFSLVGADLRSEAFSHGQLYVIISRVRSLDGLRILLESGRSTTRNIVQKEIL